MKIDTNRIGIMGFSALLMHSRTDGTVGYQNSQMYCDSWQKAKVAAKQLFYASGGHGVGLATGIIRGRFHHECPE